MILDWILNQKSCFIYKGNVNEYGGISIRCLDQRLVLFSWGFSDFAKYTDVMIPWGNIMETFRGKDI